MAGGVLWRGLGGEPGQEGDCYRWHAPDGREVLLYHLPPDGYEAGSGARGRSRAAAPTHGRGSDRCCVARAATPHVAVTVGADHHAAPVGDRARARSARRARAGSRGAHLAARRVLPRSPPAGRGRRRSPRCTASCAGRTATPGRCRACTPPARRSSAGTRRRSCCSSAWPSRWPRSSAPRGLGDRRPLLDETWRALVRSQFHDSIGGCTSDAVARRVAGRLDDVDAGGAARSPAPASTRCSATIPTTRATIPSGPRRALVLWNPVARPRGGRRGRRRPDLVPPRRAGRAAGRARAARRRRRPRGRRSPGPTGRSACSRSAGAAGHERLDAPRHYPDQDEVDVTRVAFRAPPLGGLGFAVLEPVDEPALRWRPVRAPGPRSLDNGLARADRRPRRHRHPGRPPHRACCIRRCSVSSPRATSATPTPTRRRRATGSAACAGPAAVRCWRAGRSSPRWRSGARWPAGRQGGGAVAS